MVFLVFVCNLCYYLLEFKQILKIKDTNLSESEDKPDNNNNNSYDQNFDDNTRTSQFKFLIVNFNHIILKK